MTLDEAQTELALVNDAIATVLKGGVSAYSINGRSTTKLSLKELREQRTELQNTIARLQYGAFSVARFRPPE